MTTSLKRIDKAATRLIGIVWIMGVQVGLAQDTAQRRADFINTIVTPNPYIVIDANETTNNCVLEWFPALGSPPLTSIIMPFQRVGDSSVSKTVAFGEVLISGWRLDGTGVICRLVFDEQVPSVQIVESREYINLDPHKIVMTGDRLFVLDLTSRSILTTLYSDGDPLPELQNFEVAFEFDASYPTPVPDLMLASIEDGAGEIVTDSCSVGYITGQGPFLQLSPTISGGWLFFDPNELGEEGYMGPYHVANAPSVSSLGPIKLWGQVGSYVVKNLESRSTVASGIICNSEIIVSAIPSQEMALGKRHAIMTSTGEGTSRVFYPTVRHGKPMWFPSEGFRHGKISGGRIVLGASLYTDVWIGFDDLTTGHAELPVLVWWNWRDDSTGTDPVIMVGHSAQLIGAVGSVDLTLALDENMNGGIVGLELPIPSDHANVGRVLLFQWATLTPDTQTLVLSDVYGSEIMVSTESAASSAQTVANMTTGEIFKSVSVILDTPKHDLLRAKIRASADRLTKAKR